MRISKSTSLMKKLERGTVVSMLTWCGPTTVVAAVVVVVVWWFCFGNKMRSSFVLC